LGIDKYREWAIRNMDMIFRRMKGEGLYFFYHAYKDGQAKFPAFLDDYAGLIAALIQLQEVTGDAGYLLKAKEVMESAIKSLGNAKICAVYAHNDDMMIGAIQAMKEAGLRPGKDVLTVSIDGVPDIFKAMADGEANATVELTPEMAGPALDMLTAYKKDGKAPPKWHQTPTKLYLPETAAAEYERRKSLY